MQTLKASTASMNREVPRCTESAVKIRPRERLGVQLDRARSSRRLGASEVPGLELREAQFVVVSGGFRRSMPRLERGRVCQLVEPLGLGQRATRWNSRAAHGPNRASASSSRRKAALRAVETLSLGIFLTTKAADKITRSREILTDLAIELARKGTLVLSRNRPRVAQTSRHPGRGAGTSAESRSSAACPKRIRSTTR